MKVKVKGKAVTLGKNDFLAKGGEGSVYVKGGKAYKIYEDPKKMISTDKMAELGAITSPFVVKPEQVIQNGRGKPIGYTMAYLDKTHPLCQLFTQAFRDRQGVTDEQVLALVQGMRDTVQHIHDASILIVDLNELNFLVSETFEDVYFIDVDSYQTPHFPATALMPSVRDWQIPLGDFTQKSDWFSYACVTFQLLIGMHPYKGKHAKVKGMEQRMQKGISIFSSEVKTPKVCRPLNTIPQQLRDWYEAVLENGKRLAPPLTIDSSHSVQLQLIPISSTEDLDIDRYIDATDKILGVWAHRDRLLIRTVKNFQYYDTTHLRKQCPPARSEVAVYWHNDKPLIFGINKDGELGCVNMLAGTSTPTHQNAQQIMTYDSRVYTKNKDKVMQLSVTGPDDNPTVGGRIVANVVEKASKLYHGVCIQNMLGSVWVNVLTVPDKSYQVRLDVLDDYRIVDARMEGQVLMVIGAKGGKYDRFIFRFDDTYSAFQMRMIEDVQDIALNFVTLGTGVCVHLTEEEHLEVFASKYRADFAIKTIEDDELSGDMALFRRPAALMFHRGHEVYSMRMK